MRMADTAVVKEQEKLTARFEKQATAAEYFEFRDKVIAYNEKMSSLTCSYIAYALIGFFSLFVGVFLTIIFPPLGLIAIPAGLCGIGAFFYFIYKVVSLNETIPDVRFQSVDTMLQVLAGDLTQNRQIGFAINSFGATHTSKCTDEEYRGKPWLPNHGTFNFEDPWLEISFKTKDGSAVKISAEERTRQTRKPKRKGRWKAKNKILHRFKVKFDASPHFYRGWTSDFSDVIGANLDGLTISKAQLDGHSVQIAASFTGSAEPAELILRLLSIILGHLIPVNSKALAKRLAK